MQNTNVNLEENEVKIIVLKLMQIERLLKDVRKKKQRNAAGGSGQNKFGSKKITRVNSSKGGFINRTTSGNVGARFGSNPASGSNSLSKDFSLNR
jgi:hypothetical protein